ncbi:MAG: hypothetical protein ACFFAU_13725 [Candidatus Hodarchaeota archaeon]
MKKFKDDRILKIAFFTGGFYDLILGVGVLFFSDPLILFFSLNKPNNMIFVHLTGLFLIFAGYCLIYSAHFDVLKMTFIGLGMVILRFSYFIISLIGILDQELELAYLLVGFSDAIMALVLLIPILLTEGTSIKKLWSYNG